MPMQLKKRGIVSKYMLAISIMLVILIALIIVIFRAKDDIFMLISSL